MLPATLIETALIGKSQECALRLDDRHVSRKHAQLTFERGKWLIQDLGSRNGLRQDNARRNEFALAPGIEVSLGSTTLIAESERFIELRNFCCRILGWASDRAGVVDQAMRTLRLAATGRTALVLHGESDVVPVARSLHRHTLGNDRPFVVCDPRRRTTTASVRSAANHRTGLLALESAIGGSLCVRSQRLPSDFPLVLDQLRNPGARTQLFVCSDGSDNSHDYLLAPIVVPPLKERAVELSRVIEEYVRDAVVELGVLTAGLPDAGHQWIREHAAMTLPEIEKAASRLVALRASQRPSHAAERLGMAPVSLARWIKRRSPSPVVQALRFVSSGRSTKARARARAKSA
jgi:hypothetical protein